MNRYNKYIYIFLLLFLSFGLSVDAQTSYSSEEELKKQAAKFFNDEEYEKALPLYTQLVSVYGKDPNYNYRLGVCFLFTTDDKEKPLPYLEFAVNKPDVEKEVHYYLGRAYHLNYLFDEAIAQYHEYVKVASPKDVERLQVHRQAEMCVNGKNLLRSLSDLVVIEKKDVQKEDFFRSYDISGIGGKLLVKPDEKEFKTPIDKKKKEQSIIYLAKDKSQVYFASYGLEEKTGKDIYVLKKKATGEWDKSQVLGNTINTKYDEDFPFLHPNGKTLYFSSKGHNSMGGYDIFKSTFNEATNTWNAPVNLDFPINTPDDDILYVTDSTEKEAYFSSARFSQGGRTAVFHINVERKPLDVVIVKGSVVKNRDKQALGLKIKVKDLATNNIVGIYDTNPADGSYTFDLPNGGSYTFTVESPDFPTQSDVVVVPVQYKFKPMRQTISFDLVTGTMRLKSEFNEGNDDDNYLVAMNYIKNKSKMEVSLVDVTKLEKPKPAEEEVVAAAVSGPDVTGVVDKSTETTITPASSQGDRVLTNDQIVKIAYDDAKEVENEAEEMREQADIALTLANQKNELAQVKSKEAANYLAEAKATEDINQKELLFDKADSVSSEAKALNQETVTAFNLAKRLDVNASKKKEEAELSKQYAQGLDDAIKAGSPAEAMAKVEAQEKKLEQLSAETANSNTIAGGLKTEVELKQKELDNAVQESADMRQEIADNETILTNLQADLAAAQAEDLKKGIENQITGLKQDNVAKKEELKNNEIKVSRLRKEHEGLASEASLINTVIDQSKTASGTVAATSVAAIDKAKLEQQVNQIDSNDNGKTSKQPAADIAVVTPQSTDNKTTPTNNTASTQTTPVTPAGQSGAVAVNSTTASSEKAAISANNTIPEPNNAVTSSTTAVTPAKVEENKQAAVITTGISPTASPAVTNSENTITNQAPANTIEDANNTVDAAVAQNTSNTATANPTQNNGVPTSQKDNTTAIVGKAATSVEPVLVSGANAITSTPQVATSTQAISEVNTTGVTSVAGATQAVKPSRENVSNAQVDQQNTVAAVAVTDTKINEAQTKAAVTSVTTTETPSNNQISQNTVVVTKTTEDAKSTQTIPPSQAATIISSDKLPTNGTTINSTTASTTNVGVDATALTTTSSSVTAVETVGGQTKEVTTGNNSIDTKSTDIQNSTATTPVVESNINITNAANEIATKTNDNAVAATTPTLSNELVTSTVTPSSVVATPTKAADTADVKFETINSGNASDYAVAENIADPRERQKARISALKMWADELADHKDQLQKEYFKTTDSQKKSELAKQIAATEKLYKEKTDQRNELKAQSKELVATGGIVLSPEEKFETQKRAAYSKRKPIPVNVELPEGLVYKVQVGAFRKPIPQDLFEGMKPITGETTPQGFIRYTAGYFKTYRTADGIKNEIKKMGYKDAFVVAFLNGKRISLQEAVKISGETITSTPSPVLAATSNNGKAPSIEDLQAKYTDIKPTQPAAVTTPPPIEQIPTTATVEKADVKMVGGLFYTVQIGVFSNAVTSEKLHNIKPLYTEPAPNKSLRYNVGIYNNLNKAAEAKFMVIEAGFSDAFVTAYINGKRIAMTDADLQIKMNGPDVFSKDPNINVLPYFSKDSVKTAPETFPQSEQVAATKPIIVTEKKETVPVSVATATVPNNAVNNQIYASTFDTDVTFKVQLGAFRYEVPLDIVNKFLKLSKLGIENYKDERGLTIFTAGSYSSYDEVQKVKKDIIDQDFRDAFVVAYRKGKKISIEEALKGN